MRLGYSDGGYGLYDRQPSRAAATCACHARGWKKKEEGGAHQAEEPVHVALAALAAAQEVDQEGLGLLRKQHLQLVRATRQPAQLTYFGEREG